MTVVIRQLAQRASLGGLIGSGVELIQGELRVDRLRDLLGCALVGLRRADAAVVALTAMARLGRHGPNV